MGRVSKFIGLTCYFEQLEEEQVDLTFEQIEHFIGDKLCESAYTHEAYWYLSATHIMPRSWVENGYKMINLSLKDRTVSFVREDDTVQKKAIKNEQRENISYQRGDYINEATLDLGNLVKNIEKFYSELRSDVNSRYLSWEHCYGTFAKYKDRNVLTKDDFEFLALHLGFYLSSWGMYRGSSFLLRKDYKVHIDIVKELMKKEYSILWAITCEELQDQNNLELLFLLSERIKAIYIEKRKNVKERDDVSSILITKVLMGTLGCVPAYDRFLVAALRHYKIASGTYNKASVYSLAKYYEVNKEVLEECRARLSSDCIVYPQLKMLDMGLWKIGFDLAGGKEE